MADLEELRRLYMFNDDARGRFLALSDFQEQVKPDVTKKISTAEVVSDLLRRKKLALTDVEHKSTIPTYEKNFKRIAAKFEYLPVESNDIEDHLATFTGGTGRTRRNEWDYLNAIYKHACHYFRLAKNPMQDITRPKADEKPANPLSWDEMEAFLKSPETDRELFIAHMGLGHGWRLPSELIAVLAADIKKAKDGQICCHGKMRDEYSPILNESLEIGRRLARGIKDDEPILRALRVRNHNHEPLGDNGLQECVKSLYRKAGIDGHIPYDLRDTFAQRLYDVECPEENIEALLRHERKGEGKKYYRYSNAKLLKVLEKYSPLRLSSSTAVGQGASEVLSLVGRGESGGDGGGLNSPSKRSCPESTTSLVNLLISSGRPLMTKSVRTSR